MIWKLWQKLREFHLFISGFVINCFITFSLGNVIKRFLGRNFNFVCDVVTSCCFRRISGEGDAGSGDVPATRVQVRHHFQTQFQRGELNIASIQVQILKRDQQIVFDQSGSKICSVSTDFGCICAGKSKDWPSFLRVQRSNLNHELQLCSESCRVKKLFYYSFE